MTHERNAENDHPERQEIIVDGRDGVNDGRHVSKHPDHSSDRREDAEISHPPRVARASREDLQS